MSKYLTLVGQAKAKVEAADALLKEFEGQEMPEEKGAEFDALMKESDGLKAQAERYKAVEDRDAELKTAEKNASAEKREGKGANEAPAFKHVYAMRFGDEPEAKVAVMKDLVGEDYRQFVWAQNAAYAKYLRYGDQGLDHDEARILKRQLFPWEEIERLLKSGMSVAEVKTTMVEAQGTLGGYAVPANVQQEIITRLPGLTAVRSGGARVIQLTNGNSIDAPKYTGGNDQYRGAIRGSWGSETQTSAEKNATLGTEPIIANIYTYKLSMSQSLVEDAANLVSLVTSDITSVAAIDEDNAFLTADGVGKPLGILPSSGNSLGLTEVASGNASALTSDGVKGLKRGIASQYRQNGRFLANSDTYGAIEKLKDGGGAYIFGDLSETGRLLQREALESEALPDIAANAYPLLFCDLDGYWIVERAGLAIVRFQDSNTGVNKVEYHVRRRIGGRLVEPWRFAVQKVAAS